MSSFETDFARRLRSSAPLSPGSPKHYNSHKRTPTPADVFGDITSPMRNASPRAGSPNSARKGKGRMEYGDRFIPTRDSGQDLHASYQLLPEIDHITGKEISTKPKSRRRSGNALGTDQDVRREETNATFNHILKGEMFPSPHSRTASPARATGASPAKRPHRRPMTFPSNAANLPTSSSSSQVVSSAGTTPLHHHPPPAVAGDRDNTRDHRGDRELSPASTLPPLPMHAPSTPTSGHERAPGAGPSGSHHRAHQSQVALTSASRHGASPPSGRKSAFSPPPTHPASPSTPTKKRLLNFHSPSAVRMSALMSGGLDDMGHDKYSLSPVGKASQEVLLSPRKGIRQIARTPFKVLDAPDLADDFYLNLVSWSASNVLGVGLNSCVYLWSAQTSKVTKLCDTSSMSATGDENGDAVTGLEWTNRGSTLAIGTSRGVVEIWDAEYCKRLRTMTGHTARVGALAWNNHVLSSGSRDRTILHRDTRTPDQYVRRLAGHHKQEICGLRWNPDTDQLASGGNDNKLFVWGGLDSRPTWRFGEHRAAVKAIAWSPHQRGVLASGGGTADKKIRFWNSLTGGLISELDTGSQVCNLMWSKNSNEIVSTHGYSGGTVSNQIHIWKYPSMTQVATLTGHTYRVLYLAMSPDGQTIVTGAGDETLRFWNAFQKGKGDAVKHGGNDEAMSGMFARI